MLQLSSTLFNKPVLSLRTATAVATAYAPVINPDNLKIEGLHCKDRYNNGSLILLFQDIRELNREGYIIDDYNVLSEAHDLVRLADVLSLNYQIIGKPVETVSQVKLGKVSDYAVETATMYVQKLYVSKPLFKNLSGGSLSIDRHQVHEVTNKRIIVADLLDSVRAVSSAFAA